MLKGKTCDVSNAASTATGLKIVISPSWQEAPVANHMDTVQVPPRTNQLDDFQGSCLTYTEEEFFCLHHL